MKFSARLAARIDAWMHAKSERNSYLLSPLAGGGFECPTTFEFAGRAEAIRRSRSTTAYLACFRAILRFERGQGTAVESLERAWKLTCLAAGEERQLDDLDWLLAGVRNILELRCFYYHLREDCGADIEPHSSGGCCPGANVPANIHPS